ncbi:ras-related protein Rab-13 [Lepeophtheirus salmonis]|uniref:ras-related protein Rab-13 n=1 Tax=Lepeophtheirus salmonis TaxID=72036 RepID=UPI001AE9B3C8|nr:ras-related protein Rab-13-like [Lepeophtheirus salmonis]
MSDLPPKAPPKKSSSQTASQEEEEEDESYRVPRASKYDVLLKYLLVGDSYTGKTTLLNRFVDDAFIPQFNTTIGIDFKMKIIKCNRSRVKLQIWDSAGDERYSGQSVMFYREVAVVFYCFDVSDKRTFNRLDRWIDCIDNTVKTKDLIQVLVACKCDTPSSFRQVSKDEAQTLAINKKFYYFETDSKEGLGIDEMFDDVTEKVLGRREQNRSCDESSSSLADTRESSLEPPPRRRGRSISPAPGDNPFANRRGKNVSRSFRDWGKKSGKNLRNSFRKSFTKPKNEPETPKESNSSCKVS